MRYEITTAATFDSITLADARLQIKEPTNITTEDDLIKQWIGYADATIEARTNRVIGTSTFVGWLDEWPENNVITINRTPVTSITSVQYYDGDNSLQTLATTEYTTDLVGRPARIFLESTPTIFERVNAIKITFVAGSATQAAVDKRIKQACRLLVAEAKQYRTDTVMGTIISALPRGVDHLINQLRIDEI